MRNDENDPEGTSDLAAFIQRLAELGWIEVRILQIDVRWAAGNLERVGTFAKEVIGLQTGVIDASDRGTPARDADDPDRVFAGCRPCRRRLHCQRAAPWREYHGLYTSRTVYREQVARVARGDRARRQTGGDAASRDCPAAPTSLTRADREAKLGKRPRPSEATRQLE